MRDAAWSPQPGGFLELNPHLVENYLRICGLMGERPGDVPEEVGCISTDPLTDEELEALRRFDFGQ